MLFRAVFTCLTCSAMLASAGFSEQPDRSEAAPIAQASQEAMSAAPLPTTSLQQPSVVEDEAPDITTTSTVEVTLASTETSTVPVIDQPAVSQQPAVRIEVPMVTEGEGYVSFPSCREAVDYFFSGRMDYERALMVVNRESRFVPDAVSPTGARGCAQMTSGMRNTFLQGPWDDPYWNVRAMRDAVDHPDWGWCHWDVVNYCARGGEF